MTNAQATLVKSDLLVFADDEPKISVEGNGFSVRWLSLDVERIAKFESTSEEYPIWVRDDGKRGSYLEFLASPSVANLARVASEISKYYRTSGPKAISTAAVTFRSDGNTEGPASDLIQYEITRSFDSDLARTAVIFLKGDAGAGKTFLLRQLTLEASLKFQKAGGGRLFFFVSAQGRSLANLKDILAREVQDLKVRHLPYTSISLLAKRGLLVPVIDAFDELLGAAGYGDAFGSLQDFLQDLEGHGAIVVSARSAFYETEFRTRYSDDAKASYEVIPVELSRWDSSHIRQYLKDNDASGVSERRFDELASSDKYLLSKPFFTAKFLDYCHQLNVTARPPSDLVAYLMQAYTHRESGKLLGRDNRPLLSEQQQAAFLTECADFMWTNQQRTIDRKGLELLAEYRAAVEQFTDDQAQQFLTKVTSNAGFASSGGSFAFEHDVYFDYFLARQFRSSILTSPDSLSNFLQKGQISPDLARFALAMDRDNSRIINYLGKKTARRNDALWRKCATKQGGTVLRASFDRTAEPQG